jgi:membrane protein required for colicin V production
MNWVDYAILAVIAVSVLISLVRGFVREVLSILAWIAAVWLAIRFSAPLSGYLESYIASANLRVGAAFVIIFVVVLLLGAVVNYLAAQLVGKTGLSGTDRLIGMIFGAGRGLLLAALVVLLVGLTAAPRESWWRESIMVAYIQPWVCRVGVEEWLDGIKVYTPLVQDAGAADSRSAPTYWGEYCGSLEAARPHPAQSAQLSER